MLPLNHTTAGADYLSIRSTAAKDPAGLVMESLDVRTSPGPSLWVGHEASLTDAAIDDSD